MSVDKEALRETLDVVIAKDAEGLHNQDMWVCQTECGTSGCFCGHRALMDGGIMEWVNFLRMPDGEILDVFSFDEWGRRRFGLTKHQADLLFHVENDLDDLKRIVDEICGAE